MEVRVNIEIGVGNLRVNFCGYNIKMCKKYICINFL